MKAYFFAIVFGAACGVGCLPADTRPEPAHVVLSLERDPELGQGAAQFGTTDGWTVTLSSWTMSTGGVLFDGESCNEYSEAFYSRIFDLNRGGEQRLGEMYGLNACTLMLDVSRPRENAVLGSGVNPEEQQLMRLGMVPVSVQSGAVDVQGMAMHIAGQLGKDGLRVQFDWGFANGIRYLDCKRTVEGQLEDHLSLRSGEQVKLGITVDPRNLFRWKQDPKQGGDRGSTGIPIPVWAADLPAMSLAQLMVDADQLSGNANGQISMDELSRVSVPGMPPEVNLGLALQWFMFPSVVRYADTGICQVDMHGAEDHGRGSAF